MVILSSMGLLRSTGRRPEKISISRTPNEYTSLLDVSFRVLVYSGSIYPAVPLTWVTTCVSFSSGLTILANPKSDTLALKFSVSKIFDDFTSRWMTCFSVKIIENIRLILYRKKLSELKNNFAKS